MQVALAVQVAPELLLLDIHKPQLQLLQLHMLDIIH